MEQNTPSLQEIQNKIRAAATSAGIDPDIALRIANAESVFSNAAKNTRSSARGLFQVIDQTWKDLGGDPKLRNDIDENIRIGIKVISNNRDAFLKKYGTEPDTKQLYGMHFLGPSQAIRVFNSAEDAAIKNIVPRKVIKANPFLDKMSVADFINFTQTKMDKKGTPATTVAKTEGPVPMPQAPKDMMREATSKKPSSRTVDLPTATNPTAPPMNRDLLASLGPSYQAALGAISLADSAEDEEEDELLVEKYAERFGDQTMDTPITNALADVNLSYTSPFEEPAPVQLAAGGDPSFPFPTDMSFDDIPDMPPNPTPEQEAEFLKKVEEMDARAYWKRRGPNSADELNYSPSRKMLNEFKSNMPTEGRDVGVQKMAFGGIPYKPSALIPSRVKNQVATAQSALDAYNRDVGSYNDRLNEYNTRAEEYRRQVEDYNNQINAYNAQRNQYISSYIGGENPTLFTEFKGSYNPIAGSGAKPIPIKTPDLNPVFQGRSGPNPQYFIRHGVYRRMDEPSAPGSFSASEPSAPNAPTQPTQTVEQAQAAVAAAKDKQRRLQLTYDVMQDPEKFNLSMPALFAKGGEAESDAPLATYTVVPNSAAADYEKYLQAMKGVKTQEGMTPAQRNQAMNIRSRIFDPITEDTLKAITPNRVSLYNSPMLPREITAQNSPSTLFAGIPGAKVLESTGLKDTNTRGFIMSPTSEGHMRTEDIIFVAPSLSRKALDMLYKQSPKTIYPNENPELSQRVTLAHEAEHLLKRRAEMDLNDTFDKLTQQARDENYIGSLFKKPASVLRKEFVNDAVNVASYLKDKFKVSLPGYFAAGAKPYVFDEQVASLAGIEETFGVDLTQDPFLRETLFNDADVRRAFRAITGLRQTRLDAKDLAPHTLTPDAPYYPDASKIRNRTPTPVKRNAGSPVYGEIADTGGITPDTRAALTNYEDFKNFSPREAFNMFNKIGKEANANSESVIRGSASATLGAAGDIGQEFDIRGLRNLPSSKQLRAMFPQRITQPTKEDEGFTNIGEFVPFVSPSFIKNTAQTMMNAFKKAVPTGPTTDQLSRALFGNSTTVQSRAAEDTLRNMQRLNDHLDGARVSSPVVQAVTPAARSADQLFVGRVDEFLANQKNPVTKEQLIGQLKGKFRDYEIARVEEALADLPAASKLQPADLLARVKSKYPVDNFRTSIIEPKPGVQYNDVDNVYKKDVGIINLTLPVADATRKAADDAMLTLHNLEVFGNGDIYPDKLAEINTYLNKNGLSSNYKELLNSFKVVQNSPEIKKLAAAKETLLNVGRAVSYPNLHPKEPEVWAKLQKKYPNTYMEELLPMRDAEIAKIGLKELTELSSNPQFKSLQPIVDRLKRMIDSGKDIASSEILSSDILKRINIEMALFNQQAKPVIDKVVSGAAKDEYVKLGNELQKKRIYEGQHPSITVKENPVAFSRFVDKETVIPGMGNTKVMHIIELQSDLFDDIVKKGSKTGSKEKDLAEVVNLDKKAFQIEHSGPFQKEAVDKLKAISSKHYPRPAEKSEAYKETLGRYPDLKTQLIDYIKLTDRSSKLKARATIGNYNRDEAFAGMEKSPQVLQQLMIKNSIGAAMQRGVNAITFPGKESEQAQLYEKLGPNLKQVVKDLGKGFEIRPIEMYDDLGNAYMHEGLVWSKDTAARVLKEGIKFNKGGAVDKNNLDYAKYI